MAARRLPRRAPRPAGPRFEDAVQRPSPLRRRRLLVYLAAIAAPSLVLLGLSLQSIDRQRLAFETLGRANLRLQAERLAAEIETRLTQLATAALRDASFARLERTLDAATAGDVAQAARLANDIARRHPVAAHVFVVDTDVVRWPPLRAPLPVEPKRMVAQDGSPRSRRYAPLFAQAEALELRTTQPQRAALIYRDLAALDVSPALRALALSRVARSERHMGRRAEATAAWQELADRYGDLDDPYHQPYRLTALLEMADWDDGSGIVREQLERAYGSLVEGRWPLSAEQADYFLMAIEERLGTSSSARPRTRFLAALDLARALAESFSGRGSAADPQVLPGTAGRDHRYDLYYTAGRAPGRQTGVAIDTAWIAGDFLADLQRDLQVRGVAELQRGETPDGSRDRSARVPFRRVLPAWNLQLTGMDASGGDADARQQFLTLGGATLLVIIVLGLGIVLLLRDVSRETQVNTLRGNFVNAVSHDLKTPLTLVRLYTESLAGDPEPQPAERQRFYDVILRETERLARMVERALSFSKAESGVKEYTLVEGSLVDIVAAMLEQYGPYLRQRGVGYRVDLDEPVPPARLDAGGVTEAFANLLDNAAKYSGDSREIIVRVKGRGEHAVLEVEDHGIGIAPVDQPHVFERFYRSRRDDGQGGYGLGLYLVKHVMDAHGGRIELESEPGRGSLFRLVFPPAHG